MLLRRGKYRSGTGARRRTDASVVTGAVAEGNCLVYDKVALPDITEGYLCENNPSDENTRLKLSDPASWKAGCHPRIKSGGELFLDHALRPTPQAIPPLDDVDLDLRHLIDAQLGTARRKLGYSTTTVRSLTPC